MHPQLGDNEGTGTGRGIRASRDAPLHKNMDELYRLPLVEAARRLASGEMTSEVYTRGLLLRIHEVDDVVGAWAWLEPEAAIGRAR